MKNESTVKKCEWCILSYVVWFLTVLGTFGLFLRVLKKVITGRGLDYYTTAWGVQVNYIGVLITFVVIIIFFILAPFIYWFDPIYREERSFKKKFKVSEK